MCVNKGVGQLVVRRTFEIKLLQIFTLDGTLEEPRDAFITEASIWRKGYESVRIPEAETRVWTYEHRILMLETRPLS